MNPSRALAGTISMLMMILRIFGGVVVVANAVVVDGGHDVATFFRLFE
jgi:hypothetical protein